MVGGFGWGVRRIIFNLLFFLKDVWFWFSFSKPIDIIMTVSKKTIC